LLRFLEQIEGSSGLRVMDASVTSAGRDGGVNATFRVASN
jgi:type II secretory pathway component PulM